MLGNFKKNLLTEIAAQENILAAAYKKWSLLRTIDPKKALKLYQEISELETLIADIKNMIEAWASIFFVLYQEKRQKKRPG